MTTAMCTHKYVPSLRQIFILDTTIWNMHQGQTSAHKPIATLPITPGLFRCFVSIKFFSQEFGSRAYLQKRLMGGLPKTPVESFPPLLSRVLHRKRLSHSRVRRTREGSYRVHSTTHCD